MAVEDGFLEGKIMDINSPEFAAALTGQPVKKEDAPAEHAEESESTEDKDEKDPAKEDAETESSSAEEEEEEEENDDPKVTAITKELKRVRAINKERDNSVAALTQQIADLKKQAEAAPKTPEDQQVAKLTEMAQTDYDRLQNDWTQELIAANTAYKLAESSGEEAAKAEAESRIARAQKATALLTKATNVRAEKNAKSKVDEDAEVLQIKLELTNVKAIYDKAFPDLANEASPIWKAGKKEYDANPTLMKKLGPMSEMIATALAIIKNPKLVGRDPSAVRKDLITNMEETVNTVLSVGNRGGSKGNKGTNAVPKFTDLASFNDYIEKIKGG